jgi:crotonobetainyl-CoA:carnitine CoA-transferase CaiB-like acyl-CoA transferase
MVEPVPTHPLAGMRVVDLSAGIGGGYTSKVLADGGADVVKVEPPEGDGLRWRSGPDSDSALFRYLAASKRSTVADPDVDGDVDLVRAVAAAADVVVWSPESRLARHPGLLPAQLRQVAPGAAIVAITPMGLEGPWVDRPTTPAVLEAWSGGPGARGSTDRPPVLTGGEQAEWMAGMFAGAAALSSTYGREARGTGELIDVSQLEALVITQTMYPVTWNSIAGYPWRSHRTKNLPDVHPTKDGHIGFMCVTGQQWLDFCIVIERYDWLEDESMVFAAKRQERRQEIVDAIDAFTSTRLTAEILETADMLKVPATPVGNGATIPELEHFVAEHYFVPNPRGGFLQPDVPYTLGGGAARRDFAPAPELGAEGLAAVAAAVAPVEAGQNLEASGRLPLEGVRIADFTAFWAGPMIGAYLAMLGAEVIHIESHERPDAMRMSQVREPGTDWWEWAPLYQGANTNKLGFAVDLTKPEGVDLAKRVVAVCDVVVENYRPSVMDGFGLDYGALQRGRSDLIMVRAPAYGTRGPWRERGGYAQSMEQLSGMAFLTGFPDDAPQCVNGPCDPVAGMHAAIALLLALHHRARTGVGMEVDVAMVGGALNVAADVVIEHSANGVLLEREGNRSRFAAPQGFYPTADLDPSGAKADLWTCISVATDEQWIALCEVIDDPELAARRDELANLEARRAAHDELDEVLSRWSAGRTRDEIVETLVAAGVPVAPVLMPHQSDEVDQMQARGFFERLEHSLLGPVDYSGHPARFGGGPSVLNRTPAPRLGEHNHEVLGDLLGMASEEIAALEASGIVGTHPTGVRGNLSVQAP